MVLNLKWSRDPSVPFPLTWKKFEAKDPDSNEWREYVIKDITTDQFEEAFDLFINSYFPFEITSVSFGMGNDPEVVAWYKKLGWVCVEQKLSVGCFDTTTNKMVGVNFLWVICKEDEFLQQIRSLPLPRSLVIMFDAIVETNGDLDLFAKYNVDKYLSSFGLVVDHNITKRGIAQQLLSVRKLIGNKFGLKLTHSGFSSKYSIKAALKNGFYIEREITYAELQKRHPEKYTMREDLIKEHDRFTLQTWLFD